MNFVIWFWLWVGFIFADVFAYRCSKWPERIKNSLYAMIPGSGFVSLFRFGRSVSE